MICAVQALTLTVSRQYERGPPFPRSTPWMHTGLQATSGTDPLLQSPSVLPHMHTLLQMFGSTRVFQLGKL